MGKKGKKEKKNRNKGKMKKTLEERKKEIDNIKSQMLQLGFSDEIDGVDVFFKYCDEYVNKEISWSGDIKIPGFKRIIKGILTTRKIIPCSINLKYDENV